MRFALSFLYPKAFPAFYANRPPTTRRRSNHFYSAVLGVKINSGYRLNEVQSFRRDCGVETAEFSGLRLRLQTGLNFVCGGIFILAPRSQRHRRSLWLTFSVGLVFPMILPCFCFAHPLFTTYFSGCRMSSDYFFA